RLIDICPDPRIDVLCVASIALAELVHGTGLTNKLHDPYFPMPLLARASPWDGGAGHLLALRRCHVDRRVHDGVRALGPRCPRPALDAPACPTRCTPRPRPSRLLSTWSCSWR